MINAYDSCCGSQAALAMSIWISGFEAALWWSYLSSQIRATSRCRRYLAPALPTVQNRAIEEAALQKPNADLGREENASGLRDRRCRLRRLRTGQSANRGSRNQGLAD